MSYDLSKPLVIGISSRALFNLEQENKNIRRTRCWSIWGLPGSTWEWDSSEGCCFSIDQSILRIKQHRTGKTGGSDHYVTE